MVGGLLHLRVAAGEGEDWGVGGEDAAGVFGALLGAPERVVAALLGGVVGEAAYRVAGLGEGEPVGGRAGELLLLSDAGGVADGSLVSGAEGGPLRELDGGLDTLAAADGHVDVDAAGIDELGLADGEALCPLQLVALQRHGVLDVEGGGANGLPFLSRSMRAPISMHMLVRVMVMVLSLQLAAALVLA
ncbi:hypothetical protein AMK22_11655 [Streptomyces sp. CB01580]|nr:hypothetical protein AMK22_11655 [Streptomyces sp. CB01580]